MGHGGLAGQGPSRERSDAAGAAGQAWARAAKLPGTYTPVGDGRPVVRIGLLAPLGLLLIWVAVAAFFCWQELVAAASWLQQL